MRVVIVTLLLMFLSPALTLAEAQTIEGKLATVDLQKVLQDSKYGNQAKKQLEKKFAGDQKKLEQTRDEVMKAKADLQKQAALLSKDALEKKAESVQKKERDAMRAMQDFRERLQLENKSLVEKALHEVEAIVQAIAKEKGYDFVLEKNQPGFLYSSRQIDITDSVIKELNKKKVQ